MLFLNKKMLFPKLQRQPRSLFWPGQSPDLNPIVNIWSNI